MQVMIRETTLRKLRIFRTRFIHVRHCNTVGCFRFFRRPRDSMKLGEPFCLSFAR